MKLKDTFVQHNMDGQTVIVPTAGAKFHGLIQGNKTLAAIAECLKNETTEEEVVDTLCARFDGDREDIKADVHEAVRRLREIGAIDE
ncbi:MAG: PqqD family protein [Ruminococcus sp.]